MNRINKIILLAAAAVLLFLPVHAEAYRVKKGDTLGKIARKYGVSVSRLKAWNGIKGSRIYTGQNLRVTSTGKNSGSTSNYVTRKDYYKVKKGDSLSKIAARSHTTVNNLVKLNHLKGTTVYPGRRLLIRTRRVKKTSLRYQTYTYPDTPPLIEPKAIIEGELTFYTVQEGETLESIAQKYGLTPEEIREANLMPEGSEVKKGQILSIPQEEEDTGAKTGETPQSPE